MKVKISIEDLDEYIEYIHNNKESKINLNSYLQHTRPDLFGKPIIADLSNFDFGKNKIDLRDADLSGSILDGIDFNGQNVIVKGAIFIGSSLKNTKFTNGINLDGVKFGSIALDNQMFVDCQLAESLYDPTSSKIIGYKLNDIQLKQYLGYKNPKKNINEYLEEKYGYQYPGFKIVANLKGLVIDEKYNGADLSGSNIEESIITGEIDNLILRDCITQNTHFKDCTLINPDLRGTCLATKGKLLQQSFEAITFQGSVTFDSPKLSIYANISSAAEKGLIPEHNTELENLALELDSLPIFDIKGAAIFDPCYNKDDLRIDKKYTKVTKKDILKYCSFVQEQIGSYYTDTPSFSSYMHLKPDEYIDLSGLDLKDIDFSNTKFNNCNFSFTNLSGSKFDKAIFNNCNFSGCNMSNRSINSQFLNLASIEDRIRSYFNQQKTVTSIKKTTFNDCNFTWADMTGADAVDVKFQNLTAINLNAPNLQISGNALANGANFAGSYLSRINASGLEAIGANFSNTICTEGHFEHSHLDQSDLSKANFDQAHMKEASINRANCTKTRFSKADLTGASIKQTKMAADVSSATMTNCSIDHSDMSKITHKSDPIVENISGTPLTDLNANKYDTIQIEQQKTNNSKSIYSKNALFLIATSAALTLVMPLALVELGVISFLAIQPFVVTAIMTTSALIVDAVMEKTLGYSPGVTKIIANFFGAKTMIETENDLPNKKQAELIAKHTRLKEERSSLANFEARIIEEGKSRVTGTHHELKNISHDKTLEAKKDKGFVHRLNTRKQNDIISNPTIKRSTRH